MIEPGTSIEFKSSTKLGAHWDRGELVSDDGRRCVVLDRAGVEHTLPASKVRERVEAASTRRAIAPLVPLEEPRNIYTPSFACAPIDALERAYAEQVEGRPVEPEPEPAWADEPPPVAARAPRSVVRWSLEAIRDAAPLRSEAYLDHVREHPCCVCGAAGPSHPHHVVPRGHGGMSTKTDDCRAVSLCVPHHTAYHASRRLGGRSEEATRLLLAEAAVDLLTTWIKREAMR